VARRGDRDGEETGVDHQQQAEEQFGPCAVRGHGREVSRENNGMIAAASPAWFDLLAWPP
jgi:hypothetical protein